MKKFNKKTFKKMITIIGIILLIAIILIGAGMKITFNPFHIKFYSLDLALGYMFIVAAVICIRSFYYKKGFSDGVAIVTEKVINTIEESLVETDSIPPETLKEIEDTTGLKVYSKN